MCMDFWERIMIPERIRIPALGGIWYRFLSRIMRWKIKKTPSDALSLNMAPRAHKLICTLTSFPDRINTVQYTIKSLFLQSLKPDRIVLWLAEDEFKNRELPESIKALMQHGLEVRHCDNLFGHKRYYKLLPEQKADELIVMFDDDILFQKHLLRRLYRKWQQYPGCIVCDRGQVLTYVDGEVLNPGRWSAIGAVGVSSPSFRILASPGGGCLIPYGALYKDACAVEKIQQYAIKTGDLWLMFMAVQNNTKIIRSYRYHRIFILAEDFQTVQLGKEAIYKGRYLQTFHDLCKAYPEAYKNMVSEL